MTEDKLKKIEKIDLASDGTLHLWTRNIPLTGRGFVEITLLVVKINELIENFNLLIKEREEVKTE